MNHNSRIHPLDKLISDDSLFFLEAMVPFVEYPYKKPLVLFIKYRELVAYNIHACNVQNSSY